MSLQGLSAGEALTEGLASGLLNYGLDLPGQFEILATVDAS